MKKFLLPLLLSAPAFAGELSLFFIPSPKGIDWTTPSSLALSALKNKLSFAPHFMGHVWVELKCGTLHELTGMIGENPDYLNQLLIEQKGLGILFHSFQGRLEKKEDIEKERLHYFKNGGMNFVKFIINDAQCRRASTYLTEYRKNNVSRFYGLSNKPRHGEGGGCSAFGTSFPDVLNILDQDMKEAWSRTISVPLELSGPPVKDEGVSLFKVIFKSGSWAKSEEPHKKLTFWDPDGMYQWVNKKMSPLKAGYRIEKMGNVSGVVFDKTHFPVPLEPIWQQQLDPKDKTKTAIFVEPKRPPKKNRPFSGE
jgi:hypothetical protein